MREFLCRTGQFPSMPESMVRGMLQRSAGLQVSHKGVGGEGNDTDIVVDKEDVMRFKEGQNRDHLMGVPFF